MVLILTIEESSYVGSEEYSSDESCQMQEAIDDTVEYEVLWYAHRIEEKYSIYDGQKREEYERSALLSAFEE